MAGEHRSKPYTTRDLDDMVSNFQRYSTGEDARLEVPAVIGHGEDQEKLKQLKEQDPDEEDEDELSKSDIPAAGWCKRIYREGNILKGDFSDVNPDVAKLIKGKRYKKISAEIYDEEQHPFKGKGKMLRRVALLGGDLPQVKGLKSIPMPEAHSERFDNSPPTVLKFSESRRSKGGYWTIFSEVSPMTPEEILQKLATMGVNAEVLQGCSPEALAEMLRVLEAAKQKPPEEMDEEDEEKKKKGVVGESTMNLLDEMLPPTDDPEKKKEMAERCAKYASRFKSMAEMCRNKYREYDEDGDMDDKKAKEFAEGDDDEEDQKFFESFAQAAGQKAMWAQVTDAGGHDKKGGGYSSDKMEGDWHTKKRSDYHSEGAMKFTETDIRRIIAAELSKVTPTIRELEKFREEVKTSDKKEAVDSIVATAFNEGRISKVQREEWTAILMDADAREVVAKFSEGGKKVELTQFDRLARALRKLPVMFKGEKFREAPAGGNASDDDEAAISEHFERFSEQFEKAGLKKEKLLAGFKAEKVRNPRLTAKDYLSKSA